MKKHIRAYFHFLRWGIWQYNQDREKYCFLSFLAGFIFVPVVLPCLIINHFIAKPLERWINNLEELSK